MLKKPFTSKLFAQKALNPLTRSIPFLSDWFSKPLGRALLLCEKQFIEKSSKGLFGPCFLQMSILPDQFLGSKDNFLQHISIGPVNGDSIDSLADERQIPLAHESIDLAVIHHMMEYSPDPHQFLKELTRIISPSGHIIIVGFNPWSLLGLRSLTRIFQQHQHWQNHALTARRISDWLTLMNFTVCEVNHGFYQLPFNLTIKNHLFTRLNKLLNRTQGVFGGFFIIVAKKEIAPLTPSTDYLQSLRKSMIPLMEPSLYTQPKKHKMKDNPNAR